MAPSPEVLEAGPQSSSEATAEAASKARSHSPDAPGPEEYLYLKGRPKLRDFTRYVRNHAVNPPAEGALIDEWRAAAEVIRTLEQTEAGLADDPPIGKMGKEYEPLLIEFLKDPLVQHGFETVPTEVAFVELDRLVVWQKHIDLTFCRRLEERLSAAQSEQDIFRSCLLHDRLDPPVTWSRVHGDTYVFVSPSNDLRFLGTMKLQGSNIQDYPPPGDLAGVIGLAVGFGSNFMNAIYAEKRLILNNGSHRAYTLRKMGHTRVPCIIQHVGSREELDMVASSEVRRDPDLYLKHPRPSMLRDYFHPELHKAMPVHRRLRQVTVKFQVDEAHVPAL